MVELTDVKLDVSKDDLAAHQKKITVANEHCRHNMISTINDWLSNKNTPLPITSGNAAQNDNRNSNGSGPILEEYDEGSGSSEELNASGTQRISFDPRSSRHNHLSQQ